MSEWEEIEAWRQARERVRLQWAIDRRTQARKGRVALLLFGLVVWFFVSLPVLLAACGLIE